jgi:hypothetical protein
VIVGAVIGGVIVVGLAWAGLQDYRRRRGGSPSVAENFKRQREINRQWAEDHPGPDPGGGGV